MDRLSVPVGAWPFCFLSSWVKKSVRGLGLVLLKSLNVGCFGEDFVADQ